MGPRRVGKTVMIFHAISDLLRKGIKGSRIIYISIDNPVYLGISLGSLVELFLERAGYKDSLEEKIYFFFDEIQYLKNWEQHLKSLVDFYRQYKFIASGSAAAALKLKSNESGAGRFTDFTLPPLTFHEYVTFKNENAISVEHEQDRDSISYHIPDLEKLNRLFVDYINYGGYPELVFSETARSESEQFIANDIVDKVLLKDIPSLYGIQDTRELYDLFRTIVLNSGNEVSLEALSQKSNGIKKPTINKYITYLEAAFLVKRLDKIDFNLKKFQRRTNFKLYITNPSLRSAIFFPVRPDASSGEEKLFWSMMVETAIVAQYAQFGNHRIHYARDKYGEVDIVELTKENTIGKVVEVKWSDRHLSTLDKLEGIRKFLARQTPEHTYITTINGYKEIEIEGKHVRLIQASAIAYILGMIAIDKRSVEMKGYE